LSKKTVSCIVACYKDELAIPIMYERIKKTFQQIDYDYEIIFVNDASPDRTMDVLIEITKKDSKVIGINHRRNFGSQSAFLSGMKISTGDAVVLMDGDLQDPPEIILDFVQKWEQGFNIVYGVRTKREVSYLMQFLYKSFYKIFNKVASFKIPVDAGDFSLIDRESVNEIIQFKEFDIFLRAIRAYIGGNQIGVPYFRPERMFGKSTNNFLKNLGWATKGILNVSRVPLTLISLLGATLFVLGFIGTIIVSIGMIMGKIELSLGIITSILTINLVLGLISILSIGAIGEYVGRILEETKSRPRFLVASFIRNGLIQKSLLKELRNE
jgi:glycosyltransferase involved in cell wall biosynthesis